MHCKVAPILTIFVGGNHEAANHLRELYVGPRRLTQSKPAL
jgi:hypothetical protein